MSTLPAAFLARPRTVAHSIAAFLAGSGVRRVYGLTGSHIKPLWEEMAHAGIRVIDVRHEAAAVHMAHADADLTGELAVATVTTGPGLTNAVTGIAAAHQGRAPVLVVSALPPQDQLGLGALEELDQRALVAPITRLARTITSARQVLPFLAAAFSAAVGDDGLPGPVYLDLPTDLLRREDTWSGSATLDGAPRVPLPVAANESSLRAAREAIARARRPVVISGRGAAGAGPALQRFLEATGALYLDTTESRGLVPVDHHACVPAMRSRVMAEADTVITVGRRLDFSLAYGSQVAFGQATDFVRIGTTFEETGENRPGSCEVKGDPAFVLDALVAAGAMPSDLDVDWRSSITSGDRERRETWRKRAEATPYGPDGGIHPNALIAAINDALIGRGCLTIADGGDILSFARVGLDPPARLDTGTFGCLGVGVPFAVAASIVHPDSVVVALVGDGALGFNAMELDSARRAGAKPVIVVSNNEAWNIERHDHVQNYADNPGYNTSLPDCRYDLLAQSLGLHAERVTDIDRLAPALAEAIERAPALLDVRTSRDVQSSDFTSGLADLRPLHVLSGWDEAERKLRENYP
ncbi:MAG TPA: thiamine pyrophosphate-binding protein [Mycobacteriales bacterium]|nr:thiamine pyrophosphate-binding protein [Mycobacteriales bacterium]